MEQPLSLSSLPPEALGAIAGRANLRDRVALERAFAGQGGGAVAMSAADYRRTFGPTIGAPDLTGKTPQDFGFRTWTDFFRALYESYDYLVRDAAGRIAGLRLARTRPRQGSVLHVALEGAANGGLVALRLHHPRTFFSDAWAWYGQRKVQLSPPSAYAFAPSYATPASLTGRVVVRVEPLGQAWVADLPARWSSLPDAPLDLQAARSAHGYGVQTTMWGAPRQFAEDLPFEAKRGMTLLLVVGPAGLAFGGRRQVEPIVLVDGVEARSQTGFALEPEPIVRLLGNALVTAGLRVERVPGSLSTGVAERRPRRLVLEARRFVESLGVERGAGATFEYAPRLKGLEPDEEYEDAGGLRRWFGAPADLIETVELEFEAPTPEALLEVGAGRRPLPKPTDAEREEIDFAIAKNDASYAERALSRYNARLLAHWLALPAASRPETAARGYVMWKRNAAEGESPIAAFARLSSRGVGLRVAARFAPRFDVIAAPPAGPMAPGPARGRLAMTWRLCYPIAGAAIDDRRPAPAARSGPRSLSTLEVTLEMPPLSPFGAEGPDTAIASAILRGPPFGLNLDSAETGLSLASLADLRAAVASDLVAAQAALERAWPRSPNVDMPQLADAQGDAARVLDLATRHREEAVAFFAPLVAGRLAQYWQPSEAGRGAPDESASSYAFVADQAGSLLLDVTEGATAIASELDVPPTAAAERCHGGGRHRGGKSASRGPYGI